LLLIAYILHRALLRKLLVACVRAESGREGLQVLRPGGVLSSLGVYSSDLTLPLGPFAAGLGDHTIVTTLCPGGKERMRRLLNVLASGRVDLKPLVTHRFKLDDIERAYEMFEHQRDGVLKVAITP
jgi:alcohol dehydrogenase